MGTRTAGPCPRLWAGGDSGSRRPACTPTTAESADLDDAARVSGRNAASAGGRRGRSVDGGGACVSHLFQWQRPVGDGSCPIRATHPSVQVCAAAAASSAVASTVVVAVVVAVVVMVVVAVVVAVVVTVVTVVVLPVAVAVTAAALEAVSPIGKATHVLEAAVPVASSFASTVAIAVRLALTVPAPVTTAATLAVPGPSTTGAFFAAAGVAVAVSAAVAFAVPAAVAVPTSAPPVQRPWARPRAGAGALPHPRRPPLPRR